VATTVAEIADRKRAIDAKALDAFHDLVGQLADGGVVDDAKALRVLEAAGKSPQDLEQELARRKRVAELRALIAGEPPLADRQRELNAREAANKAEFKAAGKRVEAEAKAIAAARQSLINQAQDIDRAKRELRELDPPPADAPERRAELQRLAAEIHKLELQVGGHRPHAEHEARAERHDRRAAELAAELDTISLIDIFKRQDCKRALAAAIAARDQELERARNSRKFSHHFTRLAGLQARKQELAAG
jgi:hypothetical protein